MRLVVAYREMFGQALFGDREFFSEAARCTLTPIQEKGAEIFNELSAAITKVSLVELVWHPGGATSLRISADDCFEEIERLELPINEGELTEAKIEFVFNGRQLHRKVVTVRTPNRIANRPDRYAELIDKFLSRVGIRLKARAETRGTLWSLHPWLHSENTWRAALGPQAVYFIERGLLIADELQSVRHPDLPSTSSDLKVRHLSPERIDGVSRSDGLPSRRLSATDVSGYRLDVEGVATRIAAALGCSSPLRKVSGINGAFDMGERQIGRVTARAIFLSRKPTGPSKDLVERLRQLAGKGRPLLVTPAGCHCDCGLAEVELELENDPFATLLKRGIVAAGLSKEASAEDQADAAARIVVDPRQGTIRFDGTLLSSIDGQSRHFKFLLELAKANGEVVPASDLNKVLGGRPDAAKDAAKRARQSIALSFKKASLSPPEDLGKVVVTTNGGYAMRVPAFVS